MDLKELFLKQKQATHQGTLGVLAKIPADRIGWRPAEGMLSLGQIVRHLWMSEEGVRRAAVEADWGYYEKRVPQGLFAILGEVGSLSQRHFSLMGSITAPSRLVSETAPEVAAKLRTDRVDAVFLVPV